MHGTGRKFYELTKYPPAEKLSIAPVAPTPLEVVGLRAPAVESGGGLGELLAGRRSRRKFSGGAVTVEDLSFLVWASDGVSSPAVPPSRRTAPSAGAKHPVITYLVVNCVEGLDSGVYRYNVADHALEMLRRGDFEEAMVTVSGGQKWLRGASVVFVWTALFARTTDTYEERGYRYIFLDAGHICQNLYLAVEELQLGTTAIAVFIDDEVNALVGADGHEESVLYMAAVGTPG